MEPPRDLRHAIEPSRSWPPRARKPKTVSVLCPWSQEDDFQSRRGAAFSFSGRNPVSEMVPPSVKITVFGGSMPDFVDAFSESGNPAPPGRPGFIFERVTFRRRKIFRDSLRQRKKWGLKPLPANRWRRQLFTKPPETTNVHRSSHCVPHQTIRVEMSCRGLIFLLAPSQFRDLPKSSSQRFERGKTPRWKSSVLLLRGLSPNRRATCCNHLTP